MCIIDRTGGDFILLKIDMLSDSPIYTQIGRQIIKGIALKAFKEGDELPSVRSMAQDLGVNLHTVNKAYNHLKQEGFLIVNRRKGVVVNASDAYKSNASYEKMLQYQLEVLVSEAIARGLDYSHFEGLLKDAIDGMKEV